MVDMVLVGNANALSVPVCLPSRRGVFRRVQVHG